MERHISNYLKATGNEGASWIACELCGATGNHFHHITFRSKFGSTRDHEKHAASNIVCLCIGCHNKAHGTESREVREVLLKIAAQRTEIK